MSENNLRSAFPLSGAEFPVGDSYCTCHLVEVSDLRPAADRLSWYLAFELDKPPGQPAQSKVRHLEIVTEAGKVLEEGWKPDLKPRLAEWLRTGEEDGRREWLDG